MKLKAGECGSKYGTATKKLIMLVPLFAPAIFLCVAPVPVMVFIFLGPPASTTKKIVVINSHSFGYPGSGSGSVLGMRIRIQEHGNCTKFTKKNLVSSLSNGFCTFVGMFL
jgi:hypothetical protein